MINMKSVRTAIGTLAIGMLAFYLVIYLAIAAVCGLCLDYSVSYWLEYCGKPDTFTYMHGCLISLVPVVGQLSLIAAAATFIASFFV